MKKKDKKQIDKKTNNELTQLREQIETLKQEKDELFGKLQRVSADYSNFQKRVPKQIADSIAYEKETIIKTLLPIMDNFEHTFQNAKNAGKIDDVIKGIEIIYGQMLDILKLHGVEQISALGEKFDPLQHQAMMQRNEPEKEEGTVLEEFQKGYKLNGRTIRPNKVVVNKFSEEPSEEQSQERTEQEEEKKEQATEQQTEQNDGE